MMTHVKAAVFFTEDNNIRVWLVHGRNQRVSGMKERGARELEVTATIIDQVNVLHVIQVTNVALSYMSYM